MASPQQSGLECVVSRGDQLGLASFWYFSKSLLSRSVHRSCISVKFPNETEGLLVYFRNITELGRIPHGEPFLALFKRHPVEGAVV